MYSRCISRPGGYCNTYGCIFCIGYLQRINRFHSIDTRLSQFFWNSLLAILLFFAGIF
jgi:hypothetical protein